MLAEAGFGGFGAELASVAPQGIESPADWRHLETAETYIGYERAENFASPGRLVRGERHPYSPPAHMRLNEWSLAGEWTIGAKAATLQESDGRITFRFHARDLLVMAPPSRQTRVPFRVTIDGTAPHGAHGIDVNTRGDGTLDVPRLYQLVRQVAGVDDRTFEIEFPHPGVEAYVFTFG